MSNYNARVSKLEAQAAPTQKMGFGFLHHDANGNCVTLDMGGQHFEQIGDESEEAMRARAVEATGPFDDVMWVSWIHPGKKAEQPRAEAAFPAHSENYAEPYGRSRSNSVLTTW